MKAMVDKDTCIGCELCTSICPGVFSMGEDGKSEAITGDVPADMHADAKDAAEQCPVDAISIEE